MATYGAGMLRRLKRILVLASWKTLVVTTLAIASTYLCRRFGLLMEFPLALITTAVVFPIVFSISGAYKRREVALDEYGALKALGRSIYFAARDWPAETDAETIAEAKQRLRGVSEACRVLFLSPIELMDKYEGAVYREFSELSLFIRGHLREKGLATGEVSRCNQYLSKMMVAFENIKHIYQYRTPRTLRAFSDCFIVVLPILYGPHFAKVAEGVPLVLVYAMPILFSVILVSLDTIQLHLENPFDGIGEDDVMINAEKFIANLER